MLKSKLDCSQKQGESIQAAFPTGRDKTLPGGLCRSRLFSTNLVHHRWEAVNHHSHPWSTTSYFKYPHVCTPTHLDSHFCSSALLFPAKPTWKKILILPLRFSFKRAQGHLQPLTHPKPGAVLAWGELWAPWSSARRKLYTQALGDHLVHTRVLKVVDGFVPTTTSSWLFQPNLQPDLHNTLRYHLATFSHGFQPVLLS